MTPARDFPRDFVSRKLDPWLVGGLSIVFWVVMGIAQYFRTAGNFPDQFLITLGAVSTLFIVLFNLPHFYLSYRVAYGKGIDFILRHWVYMILLPVFYLFFGAFLYSHFNDPVSTLTWIPAANQGLARLGLTGRLGTFGTVGPELISLALWFMFFTVGWHFAKQVFGIMMVYSRYSGYGLTLDQRNLLKINVLALWWYRFFVSNSQASHFGFFEHYGVFVFGFPHWMTLLVQGVVVVSIFASIVFVFAANREKLHRAPPTTVWVTWLAFHLWWIPTFTQQEFFLLYIPIFHGLQYLAVVYRFETNRYQFARTQGRQNQIVLGIGGTLVLGYLLMRWLPQHLDESALQLAVGPAFFVVFAQVFLNVHHYFIDSVCWRFNDPEVRTFVLGQTEPSRQPIGQPVIAQTT